MTKIKVNELASTSISLTDFFVKANSSGLATKTTIQALINKTTAIGDVSFKGALTIAQASTAIDGWYFANETGNYVVNSITLAVTVSDNLSILIIGASGTTFVKVDIPVNITIDSTPTKGSTNAVQSNAVYFKENKSTVFASTATSSDVPAISAFIKDIKIVAGLSSSSRYYLDEISTPTGGYKINIRDVNDVSVFNHTFTYVAPTTNPTQLNDIIELTDSGVTIRFTFDWTQYIAVPWSTTSLASHEFNNGNIFANKVTDLKTESNTIATNLTTEETARTNGDLSLQNQINSVGLENRAKNEVVDSNLLNFDNWTNVGGAITNGIIYFSQENYYSSQVISLTEQPIGTNLVFAAKMKSIAESGFYFKITLLNDGGLVGGGGFNIGIGDDDTFLRSDGYYQILKKFTTTALVDQINIEFKAKSSGSTAYSTGEGVFAYQPYIANYLTGDEFFFTDNNYFPSDFISDFSRFSEQANNLSTVAKASLINDVKLEIATYDTTVKVNNLGDSYTELGYDNNRGYIYFASKFLGLDRDTNFGNYGIGGTRLANNSTTVTDSLAMVNRYNLVPVGDMLVIMGGFNDNDTPFANWTAKLGSVSTKTDVNTIWGALCTIIEGRVTQYPYLTENVAIMTYPYTKGEDDKVQLNQTLRDVGNYYNIPVLDLEKLCGIKYAFNADLGRDSIAVGATWINQRRISYVDGKTIWDIATNPTSSADIYSYVAAFFAVDNTSYQVIARATGSNIMQYKSNGGTTGTDADYDFIGYDMNSTVFENELDPLCTHLRFTIRTDKVSTHKFAIVDGTYVTDGVHLNLLGMREKVAPIYTEFLRSILKRRKQAYVPF